MVQLIRVGIPFSLNGLKKSSDDQKKMQYYIQRTKNKGIHFIESKSISDVTSMWPPPAQHMHQGSNLALANLLNASSLSKKAS